MGSDLDQGPRTRWYKLRDGLSRAVWDACRASAQAREERLREHADAYWMYDRESYGRTRHGRGTDGHGNVGGPAAGGVEPSINMVRSYVETLTARLFSEIPSVELSPYNATYEVEQAVTMAQDALNGLLNTTQSKAALKRVAQDSLLTGWCACLPTITARGVKYVRIPYNQLFWDPAEARHDAPMSLHYWAVADRDSLISQVEGYDLPDGEKKRIVARLRALQPAGIDGPLSESGGRHPTPYEAMLKAKFGDLAGHSDMLHVVTSWRLATRPGKDDGRYTICVYGGDGCSDQVCAWDSKYDRTTFPVCVFRSYPTSEGWDGQGLYGVLAPYQYQIDRSWAKLDRELDTLGHTKVLLTGSGHQDDVKRNLSAPGITFVDAQGSVPGTPDRPYEILPASPQSPQELGWLDRVRGLAAEYTGINQGMATGGTNLGANASGIALMAEDDRSLDRFSDVEGRFDEFLLQVAEATLHALRDAAEQDKNFRVSYLGGDGRRAQYKWADLSVPTEEMSVNLEPTGALGRRKAGRIQTILELAERGAVSADAAMSELSRHADVRRLVERERAGEYLVDWQLAGVVGHEEIAEYLPTPDTPLELAVTRARQQIQIATRRGASPDVIDRLRDYMLMAQSQLDEQVAANAPAPAAPPTGGPGMPPPGMEGGVPPGGELPPELAAAMTAGPPPV